MRVRFVIADLIRNPRRTVWTTVGVTLGVGFFCAMLFFIDGLSASMTQRAAAPLAIDMQRVLTDPVAADLRLRLSVSPSGPAVPGDQVIVTLELTNNGSTPANEVVVRSAPGAGLTFVPGSAVVDALKAGSTDNPFASGLAQTGLNIGTVPPGGSVSMAYAAVVETAGDIAASTVTATFSTREAVLPIAANADEPLSLSDLVTQIRAIDGIAFATPLSFVDLAPGALTTGPARLFGFDADTIAHDPTIRIVQGMHSPGAALISTEAARSLALGVGDTTTVGLPDGSRLTVQVSGIVDLSRARALFSSRRGANLEEFIYIPNTVILNAAQFADIVIPAFSRAATNRGERIKAPPVREVDIGVDRALLDAEPGVALEQTQRIAAQVAALAGGQDFILDNISNTLAVARDDAGVAKRMFIFLGLPGAMLAAMLAAYAGVVLGSTQRRERAILRIRGASRRDLLAMLALRVGCITGVGALAGVGMGYATAALAIGQATLLRASAGTLTLSGATGALMGLGATGAALYLTGRRSINREINEDRAQLWHRPPAWRRYGFDLAGIAALLLATGMVLATSGFEGVPGSVYVGRAVHLPLGLLVLPIGAWVAGSFLGGRIFAQGLGRPHAINPDNAFGLLYRTSITQRAWPLAEAAIILGLIVALGTSLAVFAASYDGAKAADARYVVGSDLRISPDPAGGQMVGIDASQGFAVAGVRAVMPVVYGAHNVILRSDRTSDIANLAALDPLAFGQIAPLDDAHFPGGSAATLLQELANDPDAILLSTDMSQFLRAPVGTRLRVLLARGTPDQTEVEMRIIGLFDRLAGFPDGADALINLSRHLTAIPATQPAFFLARTTDQTDATLAQVTAALHAGAGEAIQIDTRQTALAKDQSSLAALNIDGLLRLDQGYALAMGAVTVALFVFGLLLQRRREYVTLRALGMQPAAIRALIGAEAGTAAIAGCAIGIPVGLVMAYYLINVLRPLFVLNPPYLVAPGPLALVLASVLVAAAGAAWAASALVNRLDATELLRDD